MVLEPILARAKVNLFLHVTGRRADGYHLLDSVAVFPEVGDRLEGAPAKLGLAVEGAFGNTLAAEPDNLVLRAAHALASACGLPATGALKLEKNLPVASGIGGGSADAAAALLLLCRLWRITPPVATLHRVAASLGADVPVCLASRPARMAGIGDELGPAPAMAACGMVLVNPRVAVPTPAVFAARQGRFSEPATLPASWQDVAAMAADLARLRNDLELPAIALCPAIAEVLAAIRAMPGCRLARMSGSGATCFGLFDTPAQAARCGRPVPGWWVWGGALSRGFTQAALGPYAGADGA